MIKLGGRTFQLLPEPLRSVHEGAYCGVEDVITVCKHGAISARELVLWHELVHALDDCLDLGLSHTKISALAFALHAFARDNLNLKRDWFEALYDGDEPFATDGEDIENNATSTA